MIYYVSNTYFLKNKEDDKKRINAWNEIVSENDEVYVLGNFADCSARNSAKGIYDVLRCLNGTKYLIKGDEDICCSTLYRQVGFKEVYDVPIIVDRFWVLSPKPLMFANCIEPFVNVFGTKTKGVKENTSNLYNLESHNGNPVSLDDIEDILEVRMLIGLSEESGGSN